MTRVGLQALRKMDLLQAMCERVGVTVSDCPRNSYGGSFDDEIYLVVSADDRVLPAYSRDVFLYRGDLDGCITFLQGWEKNLEYLGAIGLTRKQIRDMEAKHYQHLEHQRTLSALRNGVDPGLHPRKAELA